MYGGFTAPNNAQPLFFDFMPRPGLMVHPQAIKLNFQGAVGLALLKSISLL
jgi:hypothetical protein